jgi:hypothetical protein
VYSQRSKWTPGAKLASHAMGSDGSSPKRGVKPLTRHPDHSLHCRVWVKNKWRCTSTYPIHVNVLCKNCTICMSWIDVLHVQPTIFTSPIAVYSNMEPSKSGRLSQSTAASATRWFMGRRVFTARGTDCLLRGTNCLLRGTDCLLRSTDCLLRGTDCLLRGTVCLVRGTDCLLRSTSWIFVCNSG